MRKKKQWIKEKATAAEHRKNERNELVQTLHEKHDWKSLWKIVKSATGRNKQFVTSEKITVNEWITHFDKLYNNSSESEIEWQQYDCEEYIGQLDDPITEEEIFKNLSSMKGTSAPGADGVPEIICGRMLCRIIGFTALADCLPLSLADPCFRPPGAGTAAGALSPSRRLRGSLPIDFLCSGMFRFSLPPPSLRSAPL